MREVRVFILAAAVCGFGQASGQQPTPSASPAQLTLSGHFESSLGPTSVDRAMTSVGEQIDANRATDAARLQLSPIWDLTIWRYLPADPAHTLNSRVASDDDPFFTPDYLKLSARQLDYQLKKSERASEELLR